MKAILEALHALRRAFGPQAALRRTALLRRAAAAPLTSPAALRAYHEELLYLCAYPDNRAVLKLAERELGRVTAAAASPGIRAALADSGVAGTTVEHVFTLELLAWLCASGRPPEIVWTDGSAGAALDELLPALVLRTECDGLIDQTCSTEDWLRKAAGRQPPLRWLVERLLALRGPLIARDRLVEGLGLVVRWRPPRHASRTFARFPPRPLTPQREPLLRAVDLPTLLDQPLPTRMRRPLALSAARRVIDVARAALAVRHRETDPVTWANPAEVWLLRLERGVDVAVLGMAPPARRLPLESFFGFVAARNRVPLAYGGGWVFFDRCEIGVNLFDTFRGGESAHLFGQVLRVYRQLFSVRLFQVDPFQFGADNEEAIQSGAFWFYYRLGFRPEQAALARLAESAAARIAREPDYRTPARVLRRLAEARLVRPVSSRSGPAVAAQAAPDLIRLSLAVTEWAARVFHGDREAAARAAVARVSRALGQAGSPSSRDGRPTEAAAAFERLAPLIALIPGLDRWPTGDRQALLRVIHAKGGRGERAYVRGLQRHARLRAALFELAR